MVSTTSRKAQASVDVLDLKIGEFGDDLQRRKAVGQKLKDVKDSDAHAADGGAATATLRVNGDAIGNLNHSVGKDITAPGAPNEMEFSGERSESAATTG